MQKKMKAFKLFKTYYSYIEDLNKLTGTKYVQSKIGDCFNLIKKVHFLVKWAFYSL